MKMEINSRSCLLSVAVVSIKSTGEERFYIMNGSQCKNSRYEPEAGTQIEAMEESCLLAWFLWLDYFIF